MARHPLEHLREQWLADAETAVLDAVGRDCLVWDGPEMILSDVGDVTDVFGEVVRGRLVAASPDRVCGYRLTDAGRARLAELLDVNWLWQAGGL